MPARSCCRPCQATPLQSGVSAAEQGHRIVVEAAPLRIATDKAVSVGVIVNELVANALKYAFPNGKRGTIRVMLDKRDDRVVLTIEDDGVGYDEEAAPKGTDVDAVGAAICGEEGVRSVHDLHVWTVTSGFGAIAAHVVVAQGVDRDLIRRRLELTLRETFGIEHTTLQMEEEADQGLLHVENVPGG